MKAVSVFFAFLLAFVSSRFAKLQSNYNKAVATLFVAAPMLSHAQVVAADIEDVVAGIIAAIALVVLIGNAKLLVRLAIRTYGWLAASMR